jgi:Ribbon-helix-helix protein, copG family
MLRVQAQLTEEQARRLKALAREEGVSVAALLRRGADLVLERGAGETPEERRRRALEAVGRFTDAPDVARRHDDHLDEAYRA